MTTAEQSGGIEAQVSAIEGWLRAILPPGQVVSIQALYGPRRATSRCTGDLALAARLAAEADAQEPLGVYFTPNPVRVEFEGKTAFPKDPDILSRCWLPIDCDPCRPTATNATEAERGAAWTVLDRCRGILDAAGLRGPSITFSGNGWQALYPVALANDDAGRDLIRTVLLGLDQRCGDVTKEDLLAKKEGRFLDVPHADVGHECHDAKRIWALPHTRKRKAPHTEERPRRWTYPVQVEAWTEEIAAANVAALRGLLDGWRLVEDLRRGRPVTEEGVSVVERARRYVAQMPAAVSGQHGHDTTFDVAQVLVRGFSLPRSDAWTILCEYNARCQPPWSEPELLHKLESAEGNSRLAPGYLLGNTGNAGNGHANGLNGSRLARPVKLPAVVVEPVAPLPEASVPPFPLEVLPPWLRQLCTEASRALCCPPDYVAVPLLCAAGSAVGASRSLQLTRGWWVMPALYACVVAPPGSAKSPAANRALNAIRAQHKRSNIAFRAALRKWNKEEPDHRGDKPTFARAYTSDVTSEKLVSILHECPRGLLYHRDELLSWIGSMDQYREGGKGSDRQIYMAMWDHQSISIERKCHDDGLPVSAHRPCLTVYGTIQPDVLHRLSKKGEQDGFMERILFSYPKHSEEKRWTWEDVGLETWQAWSQISERLYSLAMNEPVEEGDSPSPRKLRFSDDGARVWERWYDAHQKVRDDLPGSMHACHAKLESYCARLALLVELMWYASETTFSPYGTPDVSAASVESAARLVDYFLSHARKTYGCLDATAQDREVEKALDWIRRKGGCANLRDLYRYRVAGCRGHEDGVKLMALLADRGLGQVITEKADNGRDMVSFRLHSVDSVDCSGDSTSGRSVDSVDEVSTAPVDTISVAAQEVK